MAKNHNLKCEYEFFEAVTKGYKTAEIRINDRDYRVGDTFILHEINNRMFASPRKTIRFTITHVLTDNFEGVQYGYCMLSFKPLYTLID